MEAHIYLSIGSNLGKREDNLQSALDLISERCGSIENTSSLYQTVAWGKTDQPDFLNQVIELKSTQDPVELLGSIMEIEKQLGRVRKEKWGPRIIDIDILYIGATIYQSDSLIVPHPCIAQRRFILEPLCEIAPDFIHPVLNKQNLVLMQECDDNLTVTKIS